MTSNPCSPAPSVPAGTWRSQIYTSSNLIALQDATDLPIRPSIPPAFSQPLSNISSISPSLASLNLIRSRIDVQHIHDALPITFSSILSSQSLVRLDLDENLNSDDDQEDVRAILHIAPTMDKNLKDNSLPFTLFCYSQWAIGSVFEPLKLMHKIRDQVTAQFSSRNSRTRTILIANVMNMFAKNFAVDSAGSFILRHLAKDAQKGGASFMAAPLSSVPVLDRQNAIRTLDSMLEILELQLDTQPTSECIQTLEYAAPVFRRACPEPPGKPINIVNILLDFSMNLRYFVTIDILKNLVIGLPTCFQYEVPFSLELCERVYQWQLQGNYGIQSLHGFPDQFVLLFAWINSLSETREAGSNSELVAWIEMILPQIKVILDESGDASLRIRRMAVQECWQFAVLIYLYMILCKADADDPRVIRAQKGYMRIVRGVKPGQNPDLYLILSAAVVGVVTVEECDQDTLRQRILNVREHAEPGTAGHDILLRLEDIWARTRDEGRAAVWSDLKIAYYGVTGE